MPKRTFWLTAGVALGAGTTLWAERRVRRTIEQTAARLAPDALAAEVGRTARHVAESAGDRFRDAYAEGRDEMHRHEEELWADLTERGLDASGGLRPVTGAPGGGTSAMATGSHRAPPIPPSDSARATRRRSSKTSRRRVAGRRAKSPSHLGK